MSIVAEGAQSLTEAKQIISDHFKAYKLKCPLLEIYSVDYIFKWANEILDAQIKNDIDKFAKGPVGWMGAHSIMKTPLIGLC